MKAERDTVERVARWTLLIAATLILVAVADAALRGTLSYWAGGVTATAFYAIARLARIVPVERGPTIERRRRRPAR